MNASVAGDRWVQYSSQCRSAGYQSEFRYRGSGSGQEAEPGSLEFFLLERYYLYAFDSRRRRLRRGQVGHAPYRFRSADLDNHDQAPMELHGFEALGAGIDHVCVADDVKVRIFGLETVR